MPSNRSKNAAKKNAPKGSRGRAQQGRAAAGALTGIRRDMVGLGLAVVAVAMLVSVVLPTDAVVTSAVGRALSVGFGAGAVLVPIALLLFVATLFMGEDGPVSGKAAGGLALIVVAVLSMLSLNDPGAASAPETLLTAEVAVKTGGYLGGFIAYWLVDLLGVVVGNVVLVGAVVAGAVVCGFSISEAVARVQGRVQVIAEDAAARREEHRERRDARREEAAARRAAAAEEAASASLFDEPDDDPVPVGERKTTVLKRGRSKAKQEEPESEGAEKTTLIDSIGEAATTLLDTRGRKGKKARGVSGSGAGAAAEPATTVLERGDADALDTSAGVSTDQPALDAHGAQTHIPDFLSRAAAKGKEGASSQESTPAAQKTDLPDAPTEISRPGDGDEGYELPPLSILRENTGFSGSYGEDDGELAATAQKLQGTLEEFGLTSRVEGWIAGPSVTTFKISMGEGERVNKIVNLEDDIALSLAAKSVRIFAPIPGTSLVGIEIPNEKPQPVYLSDVLPYAKGGPLECAFGRNSEGKPIVVDLAGLPHLLVAGTTGSGKSVLLNAIVMSMLMRATPEQVRLIMVDPKRVEFTGYAGLPHLYVPVVTEPRQAASALQWGVTEMERRLKVFEHYKVRDIKTFNGNVDGDKYADMENPPKHMPYFVIVIDELADLMMVAGKDVESSIVRIAQLGRAAGIHLIVATQRPSADVVTGLIRANIDNRVALSVDNSINSRIILDQKGAEQLLGKGDMLVKLRGKKPTRAQGCWVSDEEIEETVSYIKEQVAADYHEDILTAVVPNAPGAPAADAPAADDPLMWEAARIVVDSQLGSTSSLQRALSVGYARAGRIMDMLEAKGVVGPANGSKPREVLLDKEGLEDLKLADAQYGEV